MSDMAASGILDRFMAERGKDRHSFRPNTKLGRALRSNGVSKTNELDRIIDLPRYRWQEDDEIESLALAATEVFGLPPTLNCPTSCVCGGSGKMRLRPVQAAALQAIHDFGGLLGPMRVGCGKTLISFLAGTVTGSDRTLILVPAKLKRKTEREFAQLARHWEAPKEYRIMSYELLSRDRGVGELNAFGPSLIVADEAHKLKNTRAACTKRVRRYLLRTTPEAGYVDMSGTTTKRSITDYWHRQNWAIPDGLQPLPRKYPEMREWADAIDEQVPVLGRLAPGALYSLCNGEELDEVASDRTSQTQLRIVRGAYQRRLMTAPAVVGTEELFDGAMGIILTGVEWDISQQVEDAFERLRTRWELPDGHPVETPTGLWMAARCLLQGFYYRWETEPPPEWLSTRKRWASTVREILSRYRDIDTPMIAAREVDRGRAPWAKSILNEWRSVKDKYKPRTKAFWIDSAATTFCHNWAKNNTGIIWISETALGERLQKEHGIPYYGAGGVCISKMIEDETEVCCASVAANSEGRNLQQFSKMLIPSVPPGGEVWEQMLGRMHRDGQLADEVTVEVALGCYESWHVMMQAMRDAEYIERTTGQYQKLNFADVDILGSNEAERMAASGSALWNKANANFFKGV